jgi:DNA polymerase III subunit beta
MEKLHIQLLKKISPRKSMDCIQQTALIHSGRITSTDLETYVSVPVPDRWTVIGSGAVGIEVLEAIAGNVYNCLEFTNGQVKINDRAVYPAVNYSDFPEIPLSEIWESQPGLITGAQITGLTDFMSKDDLRPAMNGINVISGELCSTNGHVLRALQTDYTGREFILPALTANALKLAKKTDWIVSIEPTAEPLHTVQLVRFVSSCNDIHVYFRPINERYPDYKSVIPKDNANHIRISKKSLQTALKLAKSAYNKTTKQVVLEVFDTGVNLHAADLDTGSELNQILNGHNVNIETGYRIGFNADYLATMATNTAGELITFDLSTPNRPAIVDSDKLLMPIMLNSNW